MYEDGASRTVDVGDSGIHGLLIPTWIFTDRSVAVLEAVVSYLKDARRMSYHEIALALNRDDRTIWTVYSRASKKERKVPVISYGESVPAEILADRKLSIFESVVSYLKEQKGLRYSEIAELTARNDRTIWTVYSRVRKKRVMHHG